MDNFDYANAIQGFKTECIIASRWTRLNLNRELPWWAWQKIKERDDWQDAIRAEEWSKWPPPDVAYTF